MIPKATKAYTQPANLCGSEDATPQTPSLMQFNESHLGIEISIFKMMARDANLLFVGGANVTYDL